MTLKPWIGESIECDEPGCGRNTGDLDGEHSAWTGGYALDQWLDYGGQEIGDKHYCEEHRKPQCDECEEFVPVNDDTLCEKCEASDE